MKQKKPTKAEIAKATPRPPLVFLLNRERVLAELAELAKLHISGLLEVEPKAVTAKLELAPGGKVIPEFKVDIPTAGAIETEFIRKGIAEVWLGWCKKELVDRLGGLNEVRRHATEETKTEASTQTPAGEKTSEEAGEKPPAR